jgi:hypothetical protein
MTWIWIILAGLYVLSRIDLIPDVVAGWGWLDDIVVLFLLYRYLRRAGRLWGPATGPRPKDGDSQRPDETSQQVESNPYEVLGISPDASPDEIRRAYRHLASQYHPDKVSHLGAEFREMAETRFKEIQQAYDQLLGK